ncbi:hypothetical protein P691DRAFT_845205 [Macrolepiota fuliginosa MF-IS2]|uniref:Transcription factor domain-containing protein n=1 Tax=Macrolepiota fuliginosa MF-IS2 TaxID=1400762 RepID=A0A9P5XMP3_9AGAR|nr:hypothetical protein P691DRAFT_845205 [Macrolepiota fuliginosa MF-IS2]
MRNPKADACEWDNGQGKSKVAVLMETIENLKAHITELENPGLTTPSVKLHDPYGVYKEKRLSNSPPIPEPPHLGPHSPFSPTSTISSLPSGRHWNNFTALEAMTPSTGSSVSPSRQLISIPPASSSEVRKFLPHATELGFFLDILSFHRSAALTQHPFGHHARPTPALLTTVYLWGAHILSPTPSQVDESTLLIRALHYVVTDTLGTHPKRMLHTLQAEVLLASYFFRTGRFLEAKARLGSAVSLVLSSNMHRLRSTHYPPFMLIGINNDMPVFPQSPQGITEEGEQINGFWAVFTLHKLISFALDPSGGVCGALEAPGLQIDTPWPFDIHDYRNGYLTGEIQGNNTVKHFLSGMSYNGRNDSSLTALVVKASILCHRATYLTGQWSPNMPQRESDAFSASFHSINKLIDEFRLWIPQLPQSGSNTANTRTLLLIHSLTNAATIKLHGIFSYGDPVSNEKCVQAACDMVNFTGIDLRTFGIVNSVYGVLWQMACQVFIDEISRRQTPQMTWPTSISEESLRHNLDVGIHALATFAGECAYIRYQQLKVEEAYAAVTATTADYVSSASSSLTPSQS